MAIFDRFLGRNRNKLQTKNSSMVGYFGVHAMPSKTMTYDDLASEGYMNNAIVYRCVNEISKGAASVPFRILNADGDNLESHPAVTLISRPNPLQSYAEFMNSLFGFLLLSGNSYILRIEGMGNIPKELHLLRPDRINIKGNGGAFPDRYEYMLNGRVSDTYDVDQENGFSDLKQIKLWNPLDDYYGMSPLNAAAVEVDQHNLSSKHNINLLNNGARPSGAVIFKPKDDEGFAVNLTDSQRQQLLTDLNNRFTGSQNAGRPLLLEGDFDWKEMGLSPKDMDFINLKHMSATDIAMCFGVPSQLVGVPDAQTYANVAEARLALYEETIIPMLMKVQSDINEWLMPQFNEGLEFLFDTNEIPALSERRKRIYENVIGAVREGIMTRNEARERLGLDSVEGADGLLVNASLFALNEESPDEPSQMDDEEDVKFYDSKQTDFPNRGDDKKISLRNSEYPQFDFNFSKNLADDMSANGRKIWRAGGNIRGTEAFRLWEKAREGSQTPAVLDWIKEREAWAARHLGDGDQFTDPDLKPTLSNIAGIIAQMKWGVINPKIGEQGMKDAVLSVIKELEGKVDDEKYQLRRDVFTTSDEALERAQEIGCVGFHSHDEDGTMIYMPCRTHAEYEEAVGEELKQKDPSKFIMSEKIKTGLRNKVDDHNEKYGDQPTKRATFRMLAASFRRGIGAYYNNPQSVRPNVTGPDQWAFARVNALLYALRTGRFQGAAFDTDLLPKGHPKSTKK